MKVEAIEKYINRLLEESEPERPIWNKEQIRHGKKAAWNYADGCMIKAVLEMYFITSDERFLDFADRFISYYVTENGEIPTYDIKKYNLDNINEGKVLFPLYDLTGKDKYKKAADTIYEQIKTHPRTKEGNFWHKKIYPGQVWLDGLYMALPFYLEWEKRYNGMQGIGDIASQFANVEKNMRDAKTGLYYHAYDSTREMYWCDKKTGNSPNFWLRSIGWLAMALVDSLELMENNGTDEYLHLAKMLSDLLHALLKVCDDSGMWYQLPAKPDLEGNYLETSGSAIISYAMLKAARLKLMQEDFAISGIRTFDAIVERYLTEKDGAMSLGGICLVAGLGGKNRREGTDKYYLSEPIVEDEAKGVAPFLLAYTEIMRLDRR
jgi:unsaturated rhamnogalacturonyl hydrolase